MVTINAIAASMSAWSSGTRTAAPSPVLPMARLTPIGARMSPMTMITGPVTTRGRYRSRNSLPLMRTTKLMATYTKPAAARPHKVPGIPQVCTP